jgi:hypothetical protein
LLEVNEKAFSYACLLSLFGCLVHTLKAICTDLRRE